MVKSMHDNCKCMANSLSFDAFKQNRLSHLISLNPIYVFSTAFYLDRFQVLTAQMQTYSSQAPTPVQF